MTLQILGVVSPALAIAEQRGRDLSGDEFCDVASEVISILGAYMLDEEAPHIGVFCIDQSNPLTK